MNEEPYPYNPVASFTGDPKNVNQVANWAIHQDPEQLVPFLYGWVDKPRRVAKILYEVNLHQGRQEMVSLLSTFLHQHPSKGAQCLLNLAAIAPHYVTTWAEDSDPQQVAEVLHEWKDPQTAAVLSQVDQREAILDAYMLTYPDEGEQFLHDLNG